MFRRFIGYLGLAVCCACASEAGTELAFVSVAPELSGVNFINTIQTDSVFNLLDYEYLYNGGGVGIGDFDDDGLPDLFFTGNQVASRLFHNKGKLTFEDITASSGIVTAGRWCTGVAIVDINQDGLDDIYICTGGPGKTSSYPNLLYINQGDLTFVEAAAAYGLDDPSESNQAIFLDFDKDGDLDMYLLNGGGFEKSAVTIRPMLRDGSARNSDKLYRNDYDPARRHPVFTDISREAGILYEGFGLGVAMLDVNADTWPDIYVSNDYLSKDLLYLNRRDGTFEEASGRFFSHTSHFSMGSDVGDLNNDGWMDLLTVDMLPADHYRRKTMFGPSQYDKFQLALGYGYGYQYMRNMLHAGLGQGQFSELAQLAGLDRSDWSWAPLIADFNNDGLQDMYITNGYGKNITDLDYVNYRESAMRPFTSPEAVREALLSGVDDLPAIAVPNDWFVNRGDWTFSRQETLNNRIGASLSNGAAYADLDLDGDLDLVVSNINAPAFVLQNLQVDQQPAGSHYLQVRLLGSPGNASGIGTTISLWGPGGQQTRTQQPIRGFQSTVSEVVHFGVGTLQRIDSLVVHWPDGKKSVRYALPIDTLLALHHTDARETARPAPQPEALLQQSAVLNYTHREGVPGNDFNIQPLLLHGFTAQGPGMAVGDANGDGRDDVVIGGSYGADAQLFVQGAEGSFEVRALPSALYEDTGMVWFDMDNDGDEDLYIASGGSERYAGHPAYQDRILVNTGRGELVPDTSILPRMLTSTAAVAVADMDGDGYLDIFVGGRVSPGRFPESPASYLLRNTGGGSFEEVTAQWCPGLLAPGMVTSAVWTDVNNDQRPDLMLAGELMPVRLFRNTGTRLIEISEEAGLSQTAGFWNSITPADLDNDGDTDYLLGNIGDNTWFEASAADPLYLHYGDFDSNGSVDPIFSIREASGYYPLAALDVLARQLPQIRKHFLKYDQYARATTDAVLDALGAKNTATLKAELTQTAVLENLGGETFKIHPLPRMVQTAPVKGCVTEDVNGDGWTDLILSGNEYNTEVVQGIQAASRGWVLLNQGNFTFRPLLPEQSGLGTMGDMRAMVKLALGEDQWLLLLAKNQGLLDAFTLAPALPKKLYRFEAGESSARIHFAEGGIQKIEYFRGSGYLSQQSRYFQVPPKAVSVEWLNAAGEQTRHLKLLDNDPNY